MKQIGRFYCLCFVILFLLLFIYPSITFAIYSDGFDFPIGNHNNYEGWHVSLGLGGSWYCGTCKPPKWLNGHLGEDYLITEGSALGKPVYAAGNGIVDQVYTGSPNNWGGVVIIKHKVSLGLVFNVSNCILPSDLNENEISVAVIYTYPFRPLWEKS